MLAASLPTSVAVKKESGCGACKTGCSDTPCSTGPSIKSYSDLKTMLESPVAKRSEVSSGMTNLATTLEGQLIKADYKEKLILIDPANAGLVETVNKSLEEQITMLKRTGLAIGSSTGDINTPKSA